MAASKISPLAALQGPQELTLLHRDWSVPHRQSRFRKAVLSDVQAVYSLSHKKTIKAGSRLKLRATPLFLQEVNSTFEAVVEGSTCRPSCLLHSFGIAGVRILMS